MTTSTAPITQLMLTVQFAPPIEPLGPIEIAECYASLRNDYPNFEQINRAGPMHPDPSVVELQMPFGVARTKLSSADGSRTILFQEDRFSCGWDRVDSLTGPSGYPGYDHVLADALEGWSRLRSILFGDRSAHSVPLAGEVVYVDAFASGDPTSGPAPLSSMFNILNPHYEVNLRGYDLTWNQPIEEMIGFLQMQITGPAMSPDGFMSRFQTTGRFKPRSGWNDIADDFIKVHDAVDRGFKKLVNPAFRPN